MAKLVRALLTHVGYGSLLPVLGEGESSVADQLMAEKPKARAKRRSLKVRDLDKELVLALAAANVRHLGEKPRKIAQ